LSQFPVLATTAFEAKAKAKANEFCASKHIRQSRDRKAWSGGTGSELYMLITRSTYSTLGKYRH